MGEPWPITMDQCAARLHISRRSLQDLIQTYPFYRLAGRRKLFFREDARKLGKALLKDPSSGVPAVKALRLLTRSLDDTGFVYFVAAGPHVKVGYARNMENRLKGMQVHNALKLELVAKMPGSTELEALVHRHLKQTRVRGEWYERSAELDQMIAVARRIDDDDG